jgi:pimeloyl-ACP methyl ester carboxylesterase
LTDIGNSLITAPKAWYVTSEHLIDSLTFRDDIDDVLDSQKCTHNQAHKNLVHITKGEEKSNLFRHIQWVATSPFKVVTTPFAYTLAKPAWDIMLRRTSTLFYTPKDLEDKSGNRKKVITYGPHPRMKDGNGALYRFLLSLEKELKEDDVKITLIGHSMGAIVVNQIVNLGLDLRYENIVHMASADSIENLFNKVIPYIDCSLEGTCNKGFPVRFYSLHLHPDNENREVSARGFTPSGSLLTWIDGMYTTPKTVLDKRSGRWDNMTRAIELIPSVEAKSDIQPDIKGHMRFTIFGINDRKSYTAEELSLLGIDVDSEEYRKDGAIKPLYSTAQKHGDFDELPFWLPEVWQGTHPAAKGDSK